MHKAALDAAGVTRTTRGDLLLIDREVMTIEPGHIRGAIPAPARTNMAI